MPEIGQPSGTVAEDGYIDIPVDTEQLRVVDTAPLSDAEPETESEPEMSEPVVGRVMRPYSDDEEDTDMDPEEDQAEDQTEDHAEDPEQTARAEEPVGAAEYHTLVDRIRHLEEQNQVHQDMEEQYRTLLHELIGEKAQLIEVQQQRDQRIAELEDDARDYEESIEHVGSLVHQVVARGTELTAHKEQAEALLAAKQAELEAMTVEFDLEIADKIRIDAAWSDAARRVDDLERQVRARSAWNDTLTFAMDTAVSRMRERVRRYPPHGSRSRRRVSRRGVDRIIRQEYEDAVRRTMR